MRCNKLFLCAFVIALAGQETFAQNTTLTVAKVQDYKQTDVAAPVQVRNPFTLTASAEAQTFTIQSASVTPPGRGAIALAGISSTFFSFTSSTFATATALNGAFPNGQYTFNVRDSSGSSVQPNTVTIGSPLDYPDAPTLTNADTDWTAGALQFDAGQDFTIFWSGGPPNDIQITITDPRTGAVVYPVPLTPPINNTDTSFTIPGNTLDPGVVYDARLIFGNTSVSQSGQVTSIATFQTVTNFSLNAVEAVPELITPSGFQLKQGQPMAYQLVTDTNTAYAVDETNLKNLGLHFDSATGIIFGTPTTTGDFPADYAIQNTEGRNHGTDTVHAASPGTAPKFANSTSATGHVGVPFRFQVITTGASRNVTFDATNLPTGLSINRNTGLITGTVNTAATTAANITVNDPKGTQTRTLQLKFVDDPVLPVITSAKRVTLFPGQHFSYKITAAFGPNRVNEPTFKVIGSLPTGLNFDPKTGTISGVFSGQLERDGRPPDEKFLNDSPIVQLTGTNAHGTGTAPLVFTAAPTGTVNLSTRMFVGTEDDVLIGGFIITGTTGTVSEQVLLRAIGPSLPVNGALQDPILELHRADKALLLQNDNWQDNPTQAQAIASTGVAPSNPLESALIGNLLTANFTAVVRGRNGTTGVGLVELFDLGTVTNDTSQHAKLAQISTRGTVQTGDNVMIGGFIVQGVATKILLRGIGPELTAQGVNGALQDTIIELHNSDGVTTSANDDWVNSPDKQAIIDTTVPPKDNRESAILTTLNPGSYTAVLRGKNNTTGVALVEVYNLQ